MAGTSTSRGSSLYNRPSAEQELEGTCPPDKIDLKLKLPGHERCITSGQLAQEIIENVLTGGASGATKLVVGVGNEMGFDHPQAKRALAIAMRNGSVKEALLAEATSNPQAVIGLVGQLERFNLRDVAPFINELGSVAENTLTAAGELGGKVIDGAIEVGGKVKDGAVEAGGAVVNGVKGLVEGVGSFFNSQPEPAARQVSPKPQPAAQPQQSQQRRRLY